MTWVRIDDAFPDHPKVIAALATVGPSGMWMHVTAICWCAKHLTDGKVPEAKVSTFVEGIDGLAIAAGLVAAKLWKRRVGGFLIHDFLVYHPSAKDVKKRRDDAAGRKRASRDRHVDVTRDNPVTLARVQPRAGSGRVNEVEEAFQGTAGLDAIAEATTILASAFAQVDPVGVENAAAGDPEADLVAAARLAATWGSDDGWRMGAAASLRSAMRKLHSEQSAGRSKAERGADGLAAIRSLMENAA